MQTSGESQIKDYASRETKLKIHEQRHESVLLLNERKTITRRGLRSLFSLPKHNGSDGEIS